MLSGVAGTVELDISKMCVLGNGLITSIQLSTYINVTNTQGPGYGNLTVNINAELLNYKLAFDHASLNALLAKPYTQG
ncbi:MAG: hypothetical protein ACP5NQ_09035 [Vulcanisaeta sp.]